MAGRVITIACTLLLAATAGCGSDSRPAKRQANPISLDSLEAHPKGRSTVATVNGTPIYADCVARQALAHQLSRHDALQECIDFELLAQAANQPHLLAHPDVQEEGKQELVRSFIDARYQIRGPSDIPADLVQRLWDKINVPRYNHPELRNIVLCHIPLDKNQGPQSREYKIGETFLRGLYNELKHKRDLVENDLFAACYERYEAAGVHDMKLTTFSLNPREGYDEKYQKAVFDGPERAGMVTAPFLTEEGWQFILITVVSDKLVTTFAEAEAELRQALFEEPVYEPKRQSLFDAWYMPLEEGKRITRSYDKLPTAQGLASAAGEAKVATPQ